MNVLLIDAGNTRIKWAIAPAGSFNINDQWIKSGHINYADLDEHALDTSLNNIFSIKKIVISSVIGKARTIQLKNIYSKILPQAIWHEINGESLISDIASKYKAPEKLGADRRAMIIGAESIFPRRNILIIGTGTATTIDLLSGNKEHLGGWILPGFLLMSKSLHVGTEELPDIFSTRTKPQTLSLGIDTNSSIYNGILASQLGAIELGKSLAHQNKIKLDMLVIDGGNAELIMNAYQGSEQILFTPNLVLKGLLAWHHRGYQ